MAASSSVEKYLRSLLKYFSTREEKFRISVRPCNILYMYYITTRTCTSLSSILLQIKMTNQFLLLQIHFGYLYVSSAKFRPFTFSFVVTEFYCIDLVITLNVFPRASWEG